MLNGYIPTIKKTMQALKATSMTKRFFCIKQDRALILGNQSAFITINNVFDEDSTGTAGYDMLLLDKFLTAKSWLVIQDNNDLAIDALVTVKADLEKSDTFNISSVTDTIDTYGKISYDFPMIAGNYRALKTQAIMMKLAEDLKMTSEDDFMLGFDEDSDKMRLSTANISIIAMLGSRGKSSN